MRHRRQLDENTLTGVAEWPFTGVQQSPAPHLSREGPGMHEDQALLAMTLVARRASDWAHSVVTSKPFSDGVITRESVARFRSEILEALAILDRPT